MVDMSIFKEPEHFTEEEMSIIKNIPPDRQQFAENIVAGRFNSLAKNYISVRNDVNIQPATANKVAQQWKNSRDVQLYIRYLRSINREVFGSEMRQLFNHMMDIAQGTRVSVTKSTKVLPDNTREVTTTEFSDVKTQLDACKTILGYMGVEATANEGNSGPQIVFVDDIPD